jgi:ribosomal protein L4
LLTEPNTKTFCKYVSLSKKNKKDLLIVSEKTKPLKLSSQNLKNIELISASNLNTLSLLKAKNRILITPSAVNDIKELYYG